MEFPYLSEDERNAWREKKEEMQKKNIEACEKAGLFYKAVSLSKKLGDAETTDRLYAKAEEKDAAGGGISRKTNPQALAEAWKKECERNPKVRSEFASPEEWWDHKKMVIEELENNGRYYNAAGWSAAIGELEKARRFHIRVAEEREREIESTPKEDLLSKFVTIANHYEDAAKITDDEEARKLWEKAGDLYKKCWGKTWRKTSYFEQALMCYEKAESWNNTADICRRLGNIEIRGDLFAKSEWFKKSKEYEKKGKETAARSKELAKLEKKIARAKRWEHMNFFEKTKDWITR